MLHYMYFLKIEPLPLKTCPGKSTYQPIRHVCQCHRKAKYKDMWRLDPLPRPRRPFDILYQQDKAV